MRKIFLVLVSVIALHTCLAQQIHSIEFGGLTRTKTAYLLQFLESEVGAALDSAQLEMDRQRLTNLEILSHATFEVEVDESGYNVIFNCNELHTLLPIFSFGGIEENFWVQAGLTEVNIGGRGNKLVTYYQYYDRSSFATHLTLDRLKQSPWGLQINLVRWATLEPLFFGSNQVEYEYSNNTVGATVIRHLNFVDKIEFGGAFFTENYKKFTPGMFEGAPEEVDKQKILGKSLVSWNRVNYFYYYLNGWHNQFNLQTVQSLDNDPAFYIFFNDFKYFKRIREKGNFATRLRVGLSSNEESPFAPFVLDSYLNIRGVGNRVDRGTGAIILNTEYRHTFCEREKIAIQGVVFSDTGSWRNPGGGFSDFSNPDNFVLFAGGGVRFIHKKIFNAIFRMDYGVNLQDSKINGFVLGIGQYF